MVDKPIAGYLWAMSILLGFIIGKIITEYCSRLRSMDGIITMYCFNAFKSEAVAI